MTFSTVLIANRGEIAVRIIRAARDAGLTSVAVYADSDADALHVRLADRAYALGGSDPSGSYLNMPKILEAAKRAGADAIHPGYGFLSESAEFARAVIDAGLVWIGPDPDTIELLGDKASARTLAQRVGAPLVAGTNRPVHGAEEVAEFANAHGLPLVIKAVNGGGGRGMRVVRKNENIAEAYEAATREATTAFGHGGCLVERFLDRPRHLEAQILGDAHGRVVVVGTRDCSLQRRNQKLVEEAPAPFLTTEVRERISQAAIDICSAAKYVGAGTVEFLLGADGTLSFLEVNTRLQVEHTVTEQVTGLDLAQEQLRLAAGGKLTIPDSVPEFGHALEFRINAEDPALGFLPTPGVIERFTVPAGPGVRFDSGFVEGDRVSGSFDSLLAKLIIWGRDRPEAIARARRALAEFDVSGVATVLPFHRFIVENQAFVADREEDFAVHTRWIEEESGADFTPAAPGRSVDAPATLRVPVEIDGRRVILGLPETLLARFGGAASGLTSGHESGLTSPEAEGPTEEASDQVSERATDQASDQADAGAILAPFTGTLTEWKAAEGTTVTEGETVAILEAMKMEIPLPAPRSGTLRHHIESRQTVDADSSVGVIDE